MPILPACAQASTTLTEVDDGIRIVSFVR